MARKPARRYADMAAFAVALAQALPAAFPGQAPETAAPAPAAPRTGVAGPSPTRLPPARSRATAPGGASTAPAVQPRRPRDLTGPLVLGGAGVVLVAGCLVGWALWARRPPDGPGSSDAAAALEAADRRRSDPPRPSGEKPAPPLAFLRLRPLPGVALEPGGRTSLEVGLEQQGCDGPIRLRAEALPPGVVPAAIDLPAAAAGGRLELTAAPGAMPTEWLARLVAEAGGARAEAPFRLTVGRPLPGDITNSVGMRLALVPAGRFRMGSPKTERDRGADEAPHEVTLTRPFYLGACEVTQGQYEQVTKTDPAHFGPGNGGGPDYPVENVSWGDAAAFCRLLSALPAERAAGRAYRLPTEAEWEYACRGGALPPTTFDRGDFLSSEQANFDSSHPYRGAAGGPYLRHTAPVGHYKPPNGFGLYDMAGNVWEWCADWYGWDYYRNSPAEDPPGPDAGTHRVARGGGWNSEGWKCRAACRRDLAPAYRGSDVGFRVVLVVPPRRP